MARLTSDDEQARRIVSLAVAFSNAATPITSSALHAAYYPDATDDTFSRAFRRDRERLAVCGIVVRDADGRGWRAESSSFAAEGELDARDALLVDVMCLRLVDDPTFPYQDELRHALAKVDRAYGGLVATRLDSKTRSAAPSVMRLLDCLARRRLARIAYTNATGHVSRRVVAVCGTFGLRGNVYAVCADLGDGASDPTDVVTLDDVPLRTFRLDRLGDVRGLSATYALPTNFDLREHVLLPFQIGPDTREVTFVVADGAEPDALDEMACRGSWRADVADGTPGANALPGRWTVEAGDIDAAARWAVAAGIAPVDPPELVDSWRAVLAAAERTSAAAPKEVELDPAERRRKRSRRPGRHGGVDEARELVALLGVLSEEGKALTAEAVARRLGVSDERARTLINLLLTAGGADGGYLPLSLSDDESTVALAFANGLRGRAVRLTASETHALVAALDTVGMPADDPLRANVLAAFGSPSVDGEHVRKTLVATANGDDAQWLAPCAQALVDGQHLTFLYRGAKDAFARTRTVDPTRLTHRNERWYLEGTDLMLNEERKFRIDRMDELAAGDGATRRGRRTAEGGKAAPGDAGSGRRHVTVAFLDHRLLDVLAWPKLEVLGVRRADDAVVARLPWYGGSWLPRHLAACGDGVALCDEGLAAAVRSIAREGAP